jgi:peptide/nickel transport system substrate-binding protein
MVLYALHDAVLKPMPGQPFAPSLAESYTQSKDGLTWEFVLRKNVRFHNGDPVTAEDVKFSFERYRGTAAKLLHDKVAAVEVVDPFRVRFRSRSRGRTSMTFYGTPATGAAWMYPRNTSSRLADEGFKKHPIGRAPTSSWRSRPGVGACRWRHFSATGAGADRASRSDCA